MARRPTSGAAAAALLLAAVPAAAMRDSERLPVHARGGRMYEALVAREAVEASVLAGSMPAGWAPNATVNWKATPVDNDAPTGPTFGQRFYYDTSFCGAGCAGGAPILMEVGGEWTVTASPNGAVAELAAEMGALVVYLEHRYYGQSLPSNLTDRTAMKRYLTVEQAIADTASFIHYFEQLMCADPNASSRCARSWTIVGGSYAGALVSWITVVHGKLLTATWSSSGVVNAIFNFTAFDATVATAIGPVCSAAVRAVTAAFETAWAANNSALLNLFGTPAYYTATDMAWMLADSAAMGPQYGFKDAMCAYLVTDAAAGTYLTGWPALVAFANWTAVHYGPTFGSSCYYSTECLSNVAYWAQWNDGTTWVWECCNQLAYWQAAYPGSLRSALITTDYFVVQCRTAFGPSTFANTSAFNAVYGGAVPAVGSHRVFASQGSDDPWQLAGVDATLSPTYLEITAVCDGCSHCADLHASLPTDPAPLAAQRAAIKAQIMAWVGVPGGGNAGKMSPGAVAGIVVGSVAALVAALACFVCYRRRLGRSAAAGGGGGGAEYATLTTATGA